MIAPDIKTGGIQIVELSNGFHVWTKRIGKNHSNALLLLHGGPGLTHEYFECFEDFLPEAGFDLIYYDQLGSHYSDQPDDEKLWTLKRFTEEVEEIREALRLENFFLYGHSWGGILAMEYAFRYQHHLKGLIISNATASMHSYTKRLAELRFQFPEKKQQIILKQERIENFTNPEYEKILFEELYTRYYCRLDPWPDPFMRSFKHFNLQLYHTMQGPDEFSIRGNLKNWDRWNSLSQITIPALLLGAKYDAVAPADIQRMSEKIPQATSYICSRGSHLSMYDDQKAYFRSLTQFLIDVKNHRFAPSPRAPSEFEKSSF